MLCLSVLTFSIYNLSTCAVQDPSIYVRRKNMEAIGDGHVFAAAPGQPGSQPQTSTKVRTEFPETWLWSETTAG